MRTGGKTTRNGDALCEYETFCFATAARGPSGAPGADQSPLQSLDDIKAGRLKATWHWAVAGAVCNNREVKGIGSVAPPQLPVLPGSKKCVWPDRASAPCACQGHSSGVQGPSSARAIPCLLYFLHWFLHVGRCLLQATPLPKDKQLHDRNVCAGCFLGPRWSVLEGRSSARCPIGLLINTPRCLAADVGLQMHFL